jgi:hypothetical protein
MRVASIGPLDPSVRDRVAEFRDREGYPNYNEAVAALLEEADSKS